MSSSARLSLHGQSTLLKEGDLLAQRWTGALPTAVAIFNDMYSHVSTVVTINGALFAVSCCPFQWTDYKRRVHPPGVHAVELDTFDDPLCLRLTVVRSEAPRTPDQVRAATDFALRAIARCEEGGESLYDLDIMEFVHAFCAWTPHTRAKYTCAEFAACLRDVAGLWPPGQTTTVSIPHLIARVGDAVIIPVY